MSDSETITGYKRWQVYVSAAVAVVLSIGIIWYISGYASSLEQLFRVSPSVEGGGIGTDWLVGNTIPALDFLIALIHAADVILGVFILILLFVHWAAFRQLATRMRQPDEETLAADGGRTGGESE